VSAEPETTWLPPPPPPRPIAARTAGTEWCRLAVFSFVLALAWVIWIATVCAAIIAVVALCQIHASRGRLRGRAFAIAGLALAVVELGTLPLVMRVISDHDRQVQRDQQAAEVRRHETIRSMAEDGIPVFLNVVAYVSQSYLLDPAWARNHAGDHVAEIVSAHCPLASAQLVDEPSGYPAYQVVGTYTCRVVDTRAQAWDVTFDFGNPAPTYGDVNKVGAGFAPHTRLHPVDA
jgi:hypothetical protein